MTVFFEKVEFDRYESGLRIEASGKIRGNIMEVGKTLTDDKTAWSLTIRDGLIIGSILSRLGFEEDVKFASSNFTLITY